MAQFSTCPLVSVIIPTFNRASLISIPLESVIKQSYKEIEVIVVDDFSDDNTEEVIQSVSDSRIRYVRHPINKGGGAARNTGIEKAVGEYIAFLDSDDAWVPDKVSIQLELIQKQPYPEKIVCYTQVFYSASGISEGTFNEFDKKHFLPKRGKSEDESVADYLFCGKGKTLSSTLMLHRSLAIATKFRESFRKHQDWDFCLRLEANGAMFVFIPKPLTIWNGDPRHEHVGRNADYRLSEDWLHECRPYISSKAVAAFGFEKLLPPVMKENKRKLYAERLILDALIHRIIGFKELVKLTLKLWLS